MIAIDIGSNSLRVLKLDCDTLQKVFEYEKIVRTADNINKTGIIFDEAVDRIIEALTEVKKSIDFSNQEIRAVATAAFRKASNAENVIKTILEKTGIKVDIIDADLEGFYSATAVEYRLKRLGIESEKFLLADIGGGSTELILKYRNEIVSQSFDFGIVTVAQKYKTKENIVKGIRKNLEAVKIYLQDIYELFGKPKRFISTGGTPTTLAAMKLGMNYKNYDSEKINGTVLFPFDLNRALKKLVSMSEKERAKIVGTGREDLIIAGVLILKELMSVAGYDEVLVSDDGVREGVAILGCKKLLNNLSK
ncbi:Ppx/GppA phosphatase family protein [Nitrosophilus labii]|uniref:Ppx/GppA phosphatase family protein n=1 Tax=Nitrosophilus labii TaxID=2706014 RepID=UPI0016575AB5|nr:phosphatase [Nitrosophilus labii]